MNDENINGSPDADSADDMGMADSIRALYKAQESDAAPTETTTNTDPAPSVRDDGRDQRGRFAPKTQPEASTTDPAVDPSAAPAEPAAPTTPETPEAVPAVEAPQHWAPQDKELFGKLAPEGQKFLLDRHKAMEGDYTRKMQVIAPLHKSVEHWTPYLQQFGPDATPENVFNHLISAEHKMRTGTPAEKLALLQDWARAYDIPLGQAAQPAVDEYVDPQVAALNQKLAQLEAWKNSREQREEQYQRQQQQQEHSKLVSTLEAFVAEKTEAGTPAHPHYEAVRATMGALMSGGQADDLKTAYDMAVWARPDLRQQLVAAQQEAAVRKSAEEAKAKAQKASTAAASITGTPAGATPPAPANSLREEIARAFNSARA